MISIYNNLPANTVAGNLNSHYSNLQTSTQRLSSGLRINSAADDAAGLAIRELMRSDIAVLNQGTRNANDAISMLQTFDGALGVIDEKLIRMKELAEQAATGTYDSTQRLMIDSEFQAMASEINRIARATDFNGIKLLDGKTGEDVVQSAGITPLFEVPDGDRIYDVTGGKGNFVNAQRNAKATQDGDWDLSGITKPGALGEGDITVTIANKGAYKFGDKYLLVTPVGFPSIPAGTKLTIEYDTDKYGSTNGWKVELDGQATTVDPSSSTASTCWIDTGTQSYILNVYDPKKQQNTPLPGPAGPTTWEVPPNDTSFSSDAGDVDPAWNGNQLKLTVNLGNGNSISNSWTITNGTGLAISEATMTFNIKDITPAPDTPDNPNPGDDTPSIPDLFTDKVKIHFGTGNDSAEDYYYINKHDATTKGLGLEGVEVKTQDQAQEALVQIRDAIVKKDEIRAEYGALQNRFENTITNLRTQAENLQASESRISDTDIALEMTNFVRNQILTQSAVAMLTQANSMPQMVMRLIG